MIELKYEALAGFLFFHNRGGSELQVLTSLVNEPKEFVLSQADSKVPHEKVVSIPLGYLPTKFIKIRLMSAAPSIYSVRVAGVPCAEKLNTLTADMQQLVVETPRATLFPTEPKLPAWLQHRYPIAQLPP